MLTVRPTAEMAGISKSLILNGKTIGFVPTMGYLHEGHTSLIDRARTENDIVVVSIFVNPTQFGPNEDLDKYPRNLKRDKSILEKHNVDILFLPIETEMYPDGFSTSVEVKGLTEGLCGAKRPGHFKGVTTVVSKLFNILKPNKAYFGKKDFQQLKVIERMVRDLNYDIEIVGCPIVREKDGLAKSSRNTYLSKNERIAATCLFKSLKKARSAIEGGNNSAKEISNLIRSYLESIPEVRRIDYIEIVNPNTLKPVESIENGTLIAIAAFIGNTRLIDNYVVGEEL